MDLSDEQIEECTDLISRYHTIISQVWQDFGVYDGLTTRIGRQIRIATLEFGGISALGVANIEGVDVSTVRRRIKELESLGLAKKTEQGLWEWEMSSSNPQNKVAIKEFLDTASRIREVIGLED